MLKGQLLPGVTTLLLLTLLLACSAAPQSVADPPAPAIEDDARAMEAYLAAQNLLPLIQRSDWVNVKTDVRPSAVGDGVKDDTKAIQSALSMLEGKHPSTRAVYLPAGTYRITSTLSVTQVQGAAIYGCGRATVILWDGEAGGRMFHSNGFGRNLFFGLTWDGQGKAAVGVDHDSKGYYETRVRHQYCAFRNLTESGIRVGHDQQTASAEMMFYDCLFEKCGRGVSFLQFNDYDNAIARCVFRQCGSAVHCERGNVYVRDCHFEKSSEQDLLLAPHSHSVRRCSSSGSKAFIRASQPGSYAQQIAVQDCVVSGWSDPVGAVQLANCGPVLIFDSLFAGPAAPDSPAIHLINEGYSQTLITANVVYDHVTTPLVGGPDRNRVIDIPRTGADLLMRRYAANRWHARPVLPRTVYDVKVEFGAAGDGVKDDAPAIQRAIDAAAARGNDAQVYLPAGVYRLGSTLRLGPGLYSVMGPIARRAELLWGGPDGAVMVEAHNTDGATLAQLSFAAPDEAKVTGLRVTADRPGALTLDGIWVRGNRQPDFRGTLLEGLPEGFVVRSPHLDGEITIDRCGDAVILLDYWFTAVQGGMTVRGPTGKGFLGIQSAAGSNNDPDLTVADSASVVFGDFYTEQTLRSLVATGKPGQPPGRVTISYAKLAARRPEIITVDGYSGQVTVSRANMMYRPGVDAEGRPVGIGEKAAIVGDGQAGLPIVGGKDCVLLLLGDSFRTASPAIDLKDATLVQIGGNVWRQDGERSEVALVPDTPLSPATIKAVNTALDHFRLLSLVSLLKTGTAANGIGASR